MMEFFDSHCHFDFAVFDCDRDQVWKNCIEQGMRALIIPGVAPSQWASSAQIAEEHDGIYIGVGLHPWWIQKDGIEKEAIDKESIEKERIDEARIEIEKIEDKGIEKQSFDSLGRELKENLFRKKCVAIGECGLDALIETPMNIQQQVLDIHLQLAQATLKPLIIHCVKAHNELLQQLKKYRLPAGGVIHAFSGSYEMAAQYWAMGFYLGVGGTITYERANKTRQAVKKLPLEAILLETDAPDMPLCGRQGQRNSPENIIAIAQALADLRSESLEQIALQTTINAQQLFKVNH